MNKPAGFWLRLFAAIIDGIILSLVNWIITMVFGNGFLGLAITIVIGWLYFSLQESSAKQATIGKSLLNLKVTDTQGEPISFGKATARHFSKYISALIFCIGYLMVAFTERKQGLHDKIAGTLVFRGVPQPQAVAYAGGLDHDRSWDHNNNSSSDNDSSPSSND